MCAKSQYLVLVFSKGNSMPEQENVFRSYLQMAVFCEKVLREADGVLSVIRIVDRFTVGGATPRCRLKCSNS